MSWFIPALLGGAALWLKGCASDSSSPHATAPEVPSASPPPSSNDGGVSDGASPQKPQIYIRRISSDSNSHSPSVNSDGNLVAFYSEDVFLRNAKDSTLEKINYDSSSVIMESSGGHSVSGDGRFVSFSSSYGKKSIFDGQQNIFVRDRLNKTTEKVSIGTDKIYIYHDCARISRNGRYVAFGSFDSKLEGGDYYRYDRMTQKTELVSVTLDGKLAFKNWGGCPSISDDGRFITFKIFTSKLTNSTGASTSYLRDMIKGVTIFVGAEKIYAETASVSGNGEFVAFESQDPVVDNDNNGLQDIFVRNLQNNQYELISKSSSGESANRFSFSPMMSSDGRFVVFISEATNLDNLNVKAEKNVFVHDRLTKKTRQVNIAHDGSPANGGSYQAVISADGKYVAFESAATNLIAYDSNSAIGIFLVGLDYFFSN